LPGDFDRAFDIEQLIAIVCFFEGFLSDDPIGKNLTFLVPHVYINSADNYDRSNTPYYLQLITV
jgi:hypothetical protein